MYIPVFPYKGDQVIITSDRVQLLSRTDGIFLFGDKTVSLSSPLTINIDSGVKVLINSPKIELGEAAESTGEPVVKGNELVKQLKVLTEAITRFGDLLDTVSETDIAGSMFTIAKSGGNQLATTSRKVNVQIDRILSKVTYTK
jgi:hypothetical protein